MRRLAAVASLALALLLAACGGSSRATRTPVPEVTPVSFDSIRIHIEAPQGARDIDVEIAATGAQSERGLGYRDALPADAGMIFDLHTATRPTFWMKGMRFPLDMVWVGDDKRVASITADIPPQPGVPDDQLRRYASDTPVRYVLELNAGATSRLGLAPGSQLSFTLP